MSYLGTTTYPIVTLPELVTDSLGYQPVDANTVTQLNTTTGNYANSAYAAANTADQKAVTSGVYANSAFATANSKTSNVGTVTSVGGTGTVNGLTLTGTVTTSGNLTIGGTLDLSSPPTIGGVTANTGTFSNLSYTGTLTGGTGVVNLGSGQFYKDASGNVGIGTTSPSYQLTVQGTGQDTANLTDAGNKGASLFLRATGVTSGSGGAVLFGTTFGNSTPFAAIKGLIADGSLNTVGDLAFSTRNGTADTSLTERMRIASDGNVGIGTSTTTYRTNIVYTNSAGGVAETGLYLRNTSTGNSTQMLFDGYRSWSLLVQGSFGAPAGGFTIQDNTAGVNRLSINSSGNVGIGTTAGTTTVSSGLAINNATAANYPGLEIQTAGVTRLYFNANNAESYITSVSTNPLVISTNGSERMRINSSGSVSITQAPGQYTIDTTNGAASIANGGTVNFSNASGMLLVNNHSTGHVTIYLCGAGLTGVVSSIGGQVGTFAYNAGIAGYTWTNNYGSSAIFGFMFFRTRATA